jgi:glycosyltransferase involved in cell wall biosynthesis
MTEPLRIGVNLAFLRPDVIAGSATYVRQLVAAGVHVPDTEWTLVGDDEVLRTFDLPVERRSLALPRRSSRARLFAAEVRTLPGAVRGLDVVFCPGNFVTPSRRVRVPQVPVVHDIQHRDLARTLPQATRLQRELLFRATMRHCVEVIAVSNFTADRIHVRYGVARERLFVVHEGATHRPSDDDLPSGITSPYFLYPAMFMPHKNHDVLIRALRDVPEARLVLTGKVQPFEREVRRRAEECGVGDRVSFLGFVTQGTLTRLLESATALVYPSLYEGFGLPVLDAMLVGTPVIAAQATSVPEVAGDAAILVDPRSVSGWAEAMRQVLSSQQLRSSLAERGRAHARAFTWDLAAVATVAVLRRAASRSPARDEQPTARARGAAGRLDAIP